MEENTKKDTSVEKKSEVKSKKEKAGLDSLFKVHKAEFKKIIWPSRESLVKQTITVIVLSLFVGLIIFGFDSVYKFLYEFAQNLITAQ